MWSVRSVALACLTLSSSALAAEPPELLFYPPLADADPAATQAFDADADPVVQLIELDAYGFPSAVLASYTMTSGFGEDVLGLDERAWFVTIHAADLPAFDGGGTYAIGVSNLGVDLGRVVFSFPEPGLMLVSGDSTFRAVLEQEYTIPVAFHLGVGTEDYVGSCLEDGTCAPAGCDGIEGSGLVYDECGVCGGDGSSCWPDECGVPGGDGTTCIDLCTVTDVCGVCDGDGTSCLGCDGVPNSGTVVGCDGVCGGPAECPVPTAVTAAAGVVGGNVSAGLIPAAALGSYLEMVDRLRSLDVPTRTPRGRGR